MQKVASNSPATDAIRRRMEEVRSDLNENVQDVAEGVREIGHWQSYFRVRPWQFLGTALALGYLVVPRRSAQPEVTKTQACKSPAPSGSTATLPFSPQGNAGSKLLGTAGSLLMRGLISYVGRQAVNYLTTPRAERRQG